MQFDAGVIGIIGGMGPGAGIDLSSKVIMQTMAGSDQDHVSQVLFSLPKEITDRTRFILGSEKTNPAFAIAEQLLAMDSMGIRVAGLACNSAHVPQIFDTILKRLQSANARIRVLHIVSEVSSFVQSHYPGLRKVGILGTTGTRTSRLYDLMKNDGFVTVHTTEREQELLHSAIYHTEYGIKSVTGTVSAKARSILLNSCKALKKRGAELLVFGCTELTLAYREKQFEGLPVIDSTLVLARALIHAVAPEKLRPWTVIPARNNG